jgi:U3 small nucleolar RNA-associated protein 14
LQLDSPTGKAGKLKFVFFSQLRGRVGVDDLLGSLDKASESRKKLQKLMRKQDDLKIAEQLSRPAQERVDREVQYADTKTRVSEWLPTVQAMRKAPQVVFPLPESDPTLAKPSNAALTAKFSAENDLERQIASVLETSGITEERLAEYEALQERELSPQEIRERHAQLAKMRSLFFFQEKKNKRLKKIKSKKYRKILRHSKERAAPTLEELEELDPEAAKEERLKLEKSRAEERMTRKHKTTGKWAKYAARSKDDRFKDALNDHLRRGQDLMRKINSVNGGEGSDDSDFDGDDDIDSDADSDDLEEEEQKIRSSLRTEKRKTGALSAVSGHVVDEDGVLVDDGVAAVHRINAAPSEGDLLVPNVDQDAEYPTAGVLGMRFMKRAADKKRSEFNKLLTDMNAEDKDWQKKMESALRENQIRQGDEDEDFGEVDSDAGSDDDAAERRQQKQTESARKKQLDAQKEKDRLKKQHVVVAEGGRQKFGLIGAEKGFADATAKKPSAAHMSDAEKKSMRKISSNALSLEPGREGFEIGLSGPLSISLSSSSKAQHVPIDFDEDDENEDGATFNVNKTDVQSRVKRMEEHEQHQKQQKLQSQNAKKNQKKQQEQMDVDEKSDSESADEAETGHISFKNKKQTPTQQSKQQQQRRKPSAEPSNPWLQAGEDDDDTAVGAAPTGKTSEQKQQAKAKEQEKKEERKKQRKAGETSDGPLRLDLDKIRQDLQRQNAGDEPVFNLQTASNTSSVQRELINRAFAADHITEDQLLEEKNADAAADNEVDAEMAALLMPGWGDWAGPSVQPSRRRQRLMDTLAQKKAARQEELLGQRKDSKIKHVVINEKRNKKFSKYEAGDIPYPYKTREEYEASLRQPLGKEWNTTLMHKAVIKPKVKVKRGKIIEPIKNKQQ